MDDQTTPKSVLPTLRQHHVVRVHNPLSDAFTWQVARSITDTMNQRARDPYIDQLNLRNESHPAMTHVTQKITIDAGQTMNLPGDVAQVYVEHLVDEIINRRGKTTLLTNPELRIEVEEQVIINVDDLRASFSSQSIEEQLEQQIRDLNKADDGALGKEAANEQAWGSGLNEPAQAGAEASGKAQAGNKQPASQKTAAAK